MPDLHNARIAGLGHRAGTEIGVEDDRVVVDIARIGLGVGEREAVLQERLRGQVEFADDMGVAAVAREKDKTALEVAGTARTLPYPVLVLALRKLVDVDDRFPFRRRLRVVGDGGAAPDALGVRRVLPEVEDAVAADTSHRDAVGCVEHFENGVVVGLIARIGGDGGAGAGVLLGDPSQRLGAMHVFQPDIGVFHAVRSLGRHGQQKCRRNDPFAVFHAQAPAQGALYEKRKGCGQSATGPDGSGRLYTAL